jgi:hypothetical protein
MQREPQNADHRRINPQSASPATSKDVRCPPQINKVAAAKPDIKPNLDFSRIWRGEKHRSFWKIEG